MKEDIHLNSRDDGSLFFSCRIRSAVNSSSRHQFTGREAAASQALSSGLLGTKYLDIHLHAVIVLLDIAINVSVARVPTSQLETYASYPPSLTSSIV
jgi:hypothetical protein